MDSLCTNVCIFCKCSTPVTALVTIFLSRWRWQSERWWRSLVRKNGWVVSLLATVKEHAVSSKLLSYIPSAELSVYEWALKSWSLSVCVHGPAQIKHWRDFTENTAKNAELKQAFHSPAKLKALRFYIPMNFVTH